MKDKFKEALEAIRQIADQSLQLGDSGGHENQSFCIPKSLPKSWLEKGAENAIQINRANAMTPMRMGLLRNQVDDPLKIAISIDRYWGPEQRTLSVSFMDNPSNALKTRILSHMNAWKCGISFALTNQIGEVRIARANDGHWSYLGTDVALIPQHRATMNLAGFTMNTIDSEFYRVVRHETGHTLGMPHEHMRRDIISRINRNAAYRYYWENQRWPRQTVDQQVLTPIEETSIFGTPADTTSIMCYQMPGHLMIDGQPVLGGNDINESDFRFCQEMYPPIGSPTGGGGDISKDCQNDEIWNEQFSYES